MHRRLFPILLASAALVATLPAASRAQAAADPAVKHYSGIIAANPLGIPLDIVSLELEGAIAPGVTAGLAANYVAPGDPRFNSYDAKVRYYPGEVALKGFSVGLGLGIVHYSDISYANTGPTNPNGTRETLTTPAVSILTDYNWMIGAKQRFVVGAGLGAKRLFASAEKRAPTDAPKAYPFARFVIGLAF